MAAAASFSSCSSTSPIASAPRLQMRASPLASSNSVFLSAASGGRTALARTALVVDQRPASRRLRNPGSGGLGCRCMFGLGVPELAVIAGVAALVFGPKKLPEIGRSFGKTVKSFQEAAKEFETELKKGPEEPSKPPPAESPKAVSSEGEKKEPETAGATNST
ncbi:hypothetical protein Cni_G08129 [Canna indica]|uniref:Sec-independent protein translocase protein TATA, chloroplastic n=1 Tax=Canna indica TaxID=4628 RepID=A0AAQ3K046_9LILI|nr:hypothetical protein Cni_G08129 [Canna indica]